MDKQSIYELQLIDCNCNDCKFMIRDLELTAKWKEWHKVVALNDFNRQKAKAIADAQWVIDNATDENMLRSGNGMMRVANKMKFQFSAEGLIKYGDCSKFNKKVTFLPQTIQIETQQCFEHRKPDIN